MDEIAKQTSTMERKAIQCERDVNDMKMAEYAIGHVGKEYEGIITSVQRFGFFVQLPSTMEGLVHNTYLFDDQYEYIEEMMMLMGKTNGRKFKLADKIKIFIANANKDEGKIDFGLSEFKDQKPTIAKAGEGYKSNKTKQTNVSKKKKKVNK